MGPARCTPRGVFFVLRCGRRGRWGGTRGTGSQGSSRAHKSLVAAFPRACECWVPAPRSPRPGLAGRRFCGRALRSRRAVRALAAALAPAPALCPSRCARHRARRSGRTARPAVVRSSFSERRRLGSSPPTSPVCPAVRRPGFSSLDDRSTPRGPTAGRVVNLSAFVSRFSAPTGSAPPSAGRRVPRGSRRRHFSVADRRSDGRVI